LAKAVFPTDAAQRNAGPSTASYHQFPSPLRGDRCTYANDSRARFVDLLDAIVANGITTVVDRALAFDDAPGISAR